MKNDYLELDGDKCRIEFNWNTISNFIEQNGLELSALDDFKEMKPSQITKLIHHALLEGARLDEKKFDYSADDVGAALSVEDIKDILVIFQSHVNRKNTGNTLKKKTLFSRTR